MEKIIVDCYVCDDPITEENQTYEHIVLNAIGGKLASKGLFCNPCNEKITSIMDAELASQLNLLSNLLMVHRHRGRKPPAIKGQTKDGVGYNIIEGSKPVLSKPKFEKKKDGKETRYSATTTTDKEMRTILKGIEKKHPGFDAKEALVKAVRTKAYMNETIEFNTKVGGELALKSISKTAMNYFIYCGGDKKYIKSLIPHLLNEVESNIVAHYLTEELPYDRGSDEVNHILHLVGNPEEQLLYCYVEYFSSYSFIVKLNDKYDGQPLNYTYCYNVALNHQIEKAVKLQLSREQFERIDKIQTTYFGFLTSRLKHVMHIAQQKQISVENTRIVEESIDVVQERYPEIDGITEEMIPEIFEEVAISAAKFLDHLTKKRKTND